MARQMVFLGKNYIVFLPEIASQLYENKWLTFWQALCNSFHVCVLR